MIILYLYETEILNIDINLMERFEDRDIEKTSKRGDHHPS